MPSIAIFTQTYTQEKELLQNLSATTKFPIVTDDEIIAGVSAELAVDEKKLRQAVFHKTSVFNQFTLEKERRINMLKIEMASRLMKQTQCIYSGFLTLLIPKTITHVLKVLVGDEKAHRIDRAVEEGVSLKDAKKFVRQSDINAYTWTDFLFQKEAIDRSLYDMVVAVHKQPLDESVRLIVENLHKTSVLETEESRQAVHDMLLAALVEKALLEKGYKVDVVAHAGAITLEVNKSVYNFSGLANELKQISMTVPGVGGVEVLKGKDYDTSIYRKQRFELPSKVLLVDDEKELVQTLSERLINRDVGTYAVFDGQQALDLIDGDKPEIMVLDLKMPGIDGIEVLRRTKKSSPEIEIIILTGHGTEDDRKTCMELGAFAYLQKPVDLEELSRTIQEAHSKVCRS